MKITKLILCVASVAHVGFASTVLDSRDDQENRVPGNVVPVKRGRPNGGDVSKNKSKPGVVRKLLLDTTNILSDSVKRDRKPNPKYMSEENKNISKASSEELAERKILKIKRSSAKKTTKNDNSRNSPSQVFNIFSDDSGDTTPESKSRTVSVDDTTSDVIAELNASFGDDFGFNFDDDISGNVDTTSVSSVIPVIQSTLVQETVTTAVASNVVVPMVPGTPTQADWNETYRLLGQDATPFQLSDSYNSWVFSPYNPGTYTGSFFDGSVSPFVLGDVNDGVVGMMDN